MALLARLKKLVAPARAPETLSEPVATPTVVGMRPAAIVVPIRHMTPAALGKVMAAADLGNSLAWQELAAEIERRDLHYLGVLATRKRSVAQLPITVEPGDGSEKAKQIAERVRDWIKTDVLRLALFDMLDAIAKGFSVMEIEWKLEPGNNRPAGFIYRPQRWFEVNYQDGETIVLRSETGADSVPGLPGAPPLFGVTEMQPEKFVIHRHPSWSGLTIHSGLTRAVAWAIMFKMFTLRDWAVFVQNYGLPMRVGKYGPDASREDREVLWEAVTDIAGSCAAIMPKGMDVEFIEPKNGAGSNDLHQRRADWFDAQISKAVLGQTGTTDSKQGAHASSQTHRLVQEDIERADALLLSATVNIQIIRRMVDFTFGPQKVYPRVSIGRPDELPFDLLMQLLQWGGPQGFKIRAQDLYDRANLTPPEEGDELIGQMAVASPPSPAEDKPPVDRPGEDKPARQPPASTRTPQAEEQAAPVEGKDGRVALHTRVGRLLDLHARAEASALVQAMSERLAGDAAKALSEMSAPVREAIESSDSFEEAQGKIADLELPTAAFEQALAQSMELAFLMGDAWALDQMGDATPEN